MSSIRRLHFAAALVLAFAAPLGCRGAGDSKLTLRYHPPMGASYHYTLEQHNTMKFESGPMAQMPEQQLTMRMYFSQTVTGPTQGGIGALVTFDSTTMDSPLTPPGGYGPTLDRMRGLTSTVVYDDRMNVVRTAFTNAGTTLSPLIQQLGKNLKGLAFPLPAGPVEVGDSWTAEMELPISQVASASAPLKAKTKLTVKEIHAGGPDTTVLVGLETTFPTDPVTITQQGQQVTLKMSGTLTGEQLLSITRGAAVHSSMGGTVKINVAGGQLGAAGMDMSVQQSTSLQLDDAK
jgi:hypothetical protein